MASERGAEPNEARKCSPMHFSPTLMLVQGRPVVIRETTNPTTAHLRPRFPRQQSAKQLERELAEWPALNRQHRKDRNWRS
jgi:hypothetical protein